jgi:hypothetical protein
MISVADGEIPRPLPLGPSGSVSVSRYISGSGFVNIIGLVAVTTGELVEENVD